MRPALPGAGHPRRRKWRYTRMPHTHTAPRTDVLPTLFSAATPFQLVSLTAAAGATPSSPALIFFSPFLRACDAPASAHAVCAGGSTTRLGNSAHRDGATWLLHTVSFVISRISWEGAAQAEAIKMTEQSPHPPRPPCLSTRRRNWRRRRWRWRRWGPAHQATRHSSLGRQCCRQNNLRDWRRWTQLQGSRPSPHNAPAQRRRRAGWPRRAGRRRRRWRGTGRRRVGGLGVPGRRVLHSVPAQGIPWRAWVAAHQGGCTIDAPALTLVGLFINRDAQAVGPRPRQEHAAPGRGGTRVAAGAPAAERRPMTVGQLPARAAGHANRRARGISHGQLGLVAHARRRRGVTQQRRQRLQRGRGGEPKQAMVEEHTAGSPSSAVLPAAIPPAVLLPSPCHVPWQRSLCRRWPPCPAGWQMCPPTPGWRPCSAAVPPAQHNRQLSTNRLQAACRAGNPRGTPRAHLTSCQVAAGLAEKSRAAMPDTSGVLCSAAARQGVGAGSTQGHQRASSPITAVLSSPSSRRAAVLQRPLTKEVPVAKA